MKRSQIVKAIQEVLEEMSTTGAVGGYSTPNAFAKPAKASTPGLELWE